MATPSRSTALPLGLAASLLSTACGDEVCLADGSTPDASQAEACGAPSTEPPPDEVAETGPLFDTRYCEVLLGQPDGGEGLLVEAYNTIGCSACPSAAWEALDTEVLAAESSALFARLNGPRHWVLDGISSSTITNRCDVAFGDLDMSLVATIPIALDDLDLLSGGLAYTANPVERETVWHYDAGRRVYTLEDPSGRCFIMQSYSQKVDVDQAVVDLESLGDRLDLPPGWSFRSLVLDADLALEAPDGVAEVLSDELENAYQHLHDGCL